MNRRNIDFFRQTLRDVLSSTDSDISENDKMKLRVLIDLLAVAKDRDEVFEKAKNVLYAISWVKEILDFIMKKDE